MPTFSPAAISSVMLFSALTVWPGYEKVRFFSPIFPGTWSCEEMISRGSLHRKFHYVIQSFKGFLARWNRVARLATWAIGGSNLSGQNDHGYQPTLRQISY